MSLLRKISSKLNYTHIKYFNINTYTESTCASCGCGVYINGSVTTDDNIYYFEYQGGCLTNSDNLSIDEDFSDQEDFYSLKYE